MNENTQRTSDQSAPVSDTPKTDAVTRSAQYWPINAHVVPVHFARAQERRIAKLVEALNEAREWNWLDGDVPSKVGAQIDSAIQEATQP